MTPLYKDIIPNRAFFAATSGTLPKSLDTMCPKMRNIATKKQVRFLLKEHESHEPPNNLSHCTLKENK